MVDKGKTAFVIQGVNNVRGAIHQVAIEVLRLFEPGVYAAVLRFQPGFLNRVFYGTQQFFRLIRFAHKVISTQPHGFYRRIQGFGAADYNYRGASGVGSQFGQHFKSIHARHGKIQQHQVKLDIRHQLQRIASRGADFGIVAMHVEQVLQTLCQALIVINNQQTWLGH